MIQALLAGGGLLLNGIKTIFGDRSAREQFGHTQTMASLNQFAAEFGRPPRTWWGSLIDGLNRLPRPMMVFSVFYVLWLARYDLPEFYLLMQAMATVPLWFAGIMTTIVVFYFGGRHREKLAQLRPPSAEQINAMLDAMERAQNLKSGKVMQVNAPTDRPRYKLDDLLPEKPPKTTDKPDELDHAPRDNP